LKPRKIAIGGKTASNVIEHAAGATKKGTNAG
jgi:hypothetical protein